MPFRTRAVPISTIFATRPLVLALPCEAEKGSDAMEMGRACTSGSVDGSEFFLGQDTFPRYTSSRRSHALHRGTIDEGVLDGVAEEAPGRRERVVSFRRRERLEPLEDVARGDIADRLTAEREVLEEPRVVLQGARLHRSRFDALRAVGEIVRLGSVKGSVSGPDLAESFLREESLGLAASAGQAQKRPRPYRLPATRGDKDDEGLPVLPDANAKAFERAVPQSARLGGSDGCSVSTVLAPPWPELRCAAMWRDGSRNRQNL